MRRREQDTTDGAGEATLTTGLRIPGGIRALAARFRHRDQDSIEEDGAARTTGLRIPESFRTLTARFRKQDTPAAETHSETPGLSGLHA